ncbi:MAG: SPFH domain-containing protein [Clostridia bacterium]|nr:SPFH domain-containing protein [Clostridia bacterium]
MGLLSGIVNLGSNLLTAGKGAVGSALQDQWKEFFYCESIPNDTLMVKGQKVITSRSANTKASDNIISNGSGIVVADGQFMIIVEQGRVVEVCGEPGEFTYDSSTEPSIFSGKLGKSIVDTFKIMWRRFTYGGDTAKDQRVYYFNTKEILDNKFGTQSPVMFKVVDTKISLDLDVPIKCSGVYTFRIANPLLFYASIAGNVKDVYKKDDDGLATTMKGEFIHALQPALGKISQLEIRPSELTLHVNELGEAVNEELSRQWGEGRGIEVVKVALNPIVLDEEWQNKISEAQYEARYRNIDLAAAGLTQAQIEAMKKAADNEGGAMTGFLGLGLAQNAGGMNAGNLYQLAANQQPTQPAQPAQPAAPADAWVCPVCGKQASGNFCINCGTKKPAAQPAPETWTCPKCGKPATGNFCTECGTKKPEAKPAEEGWTCPNCGKLNKGNFCTDCGEKRPAGAPLYRCDKCGWEPEDPHNPPKHCPNCGDIFDDNDKI